MDELVKRLREDVPTALANCDFDFVEGWSKEAADAIEELQKVVEKEQAFAKCWEEMATDCKERFQKLLDAYPKWIPVTERLPEDFKFVLVVEDGIVFMAHCEHYYGEEKTFVEWHDTMYYPVSPTHWMPLPEQPKEET